MNLEKQKKAYRYLVKSAKLLDEEFNDNFKNKFDTWEWHQICLTIGFLKELIKNLQDEKSLEKVNKTYKLIKSEQ